MAGLGRRGGRAQDGPRPVQEQVPENHSRLPAGGGRLPGGEGGQFQRPPAARGVLSRPPGAGGKTYGYPKDGNALGMAYNTKVLDAAGVKAPTTLAEMTTVGAALKAK